MKVENYIVNILKSCGVTDSFGIPGGVVLKLLQEMQNHAPELTPHLCYHEQSAGFAACGYAQAKGKLGVAYATRGPGIMNMLTCIAEAYQESLPVLFITAHGDRSSSQARFDQNQELEVVSVVEGFTKFAANIDTIDDVVKKVPTACQLANAGRKGPVLLDFSTSLWGKEVDTNFKIDNPIECEIYVDEITSILEKAKRPVLLIGDGLRHCLDQDILYSLIERLQIPVLSSRGSQDLLAGSPYYYGYVGSHGVRYSNFILSKADFILALGNRLAFSLKSKSFAPILENAEIVRVDIDSDELTREIPNTKTLCCDAGQVLKKIGNFASVPDVGFWLKACARLKDELLETDCTEPVEKLVGFMRKQPNQIIYVCDVGNNEFWFSRAFEWMGQKGTVLSSKSFGTLGSAIGKSIGAYYATNKSVICVVGDQGFQYNLQELQYIKQHNLPIKMVVLNNRSSGMIKDHEAKVLNGSEIHVTEKNGYYASNIQAIATAYGLTYCNCNDSDDYEAEAYGIYEIEIPAISLTPNLPKGNPCQDMEPLLDRQLYERLNQM